MIMKTKISLPVWPWVSWQFRQMIVVKRVSSKTKGQTHSGNLQRKGGARDLLPA